MTNLAIENQISLDKNILIVLLENDELNFEINYLMENFCGKVVSERSEMQSALNKRLYVC